MLHRPIVVDEGNAISVTRAREPKPMASPTPRSGEITLPGISDGESFRTPDDLLLSSSFGTLCSLSRFLIFRPYSAEQLTRDNSKSVAVSLENYDEERE